MKRIALVGVVAFCFAVPCLRAQTSQQSDHFEVGVFADYFRLARTRPPLNLVGVGARAGFNISQNWQLEAEMSYDFKRNFTSTFSNGFTTQLVTTRLRTLHGLFGPKMNLNVGPLHTFATVKFGFVNFSASNLNASQGFVGALGSVTTGDTRPVIYPGGGIEAFIGPLGLRLEAGDDLYFDHGIRSNLKVTFGPEIRF